MTALAIEQPRIRLREYQEEAIEAVYRRYAEGIQRQLLGLPTGSGKTIIFGHLAREVVVEGRFHRPGIHRPGVRVEESQGRVLILAHRDELIRQARGKLLQIDPDLTHHIGVVKAEENFVDAPIVIASVQTVCRPNRLEQLVEAGGFDFVVVDEAHHSTAETYMRVLEAVGCMDEDGPLTLGVTATIKRNDDKALGNLWQEIVYHRTILDMIAAGYLCDLRGVCVKLRELDLASVRVNSGTRDFVAGELGQAMHDADAPTHAVESYLAHAAGRKGLIFTPDVATSIEMEDAFNAAGIPTAHVDATTPPELRHDIFSRLALGPENGGLQLVTNCQVATEGFDEPSLETIIIARPTRSEILYVQMIGRGTRIAPDKDDCLVLDLVGATERNDLISLPQLFGLERKELEEETVLEALEAQSIREEKERREGELVARHVDLFRRRHFEWIRVDADLWMIEIPNLRVGLSQQPDDTWTVKVSTKFTQGGRTWWRKRVLGEGYDLGYAQGVGEDYLRENGGDRFARPSARWRTDDATDPQLNELRRLRVPVNGSLTKGEAHTLIARERMRRRLGRR